MKELVGGLFRVSKNEEFTASLESQYRRATEMVIADLERKGLLGSHSLGAIPRLDSKQDQGFVGKIQGSFLGFQGGVYGEGGTEPAFTLAWTTNAEHPLLVVSTIPTSKVFIRPAEVEQPQVSFSFNLPHFLKLNKGVVFGSVKNAILPVFYSHPNDYIKPEAINYAVIEVDPDSLQKFQSLQFGQQLSS